MSRRDVAQRAADRLGRAESALRDASWIVPATGAVVVVAALAHALLQAPATAWVSVLALAACGLVAGDAALTLAAGALVLHGAADIVADLPGWRWQPLLRGAGLLAVTAAAGGTGVLLRNYEEARRRGRDEDAVTGLLNVRAFYEQLGDRRSAGRSFAIVVADIAGMRSLNERFGHPIGTEAMRALGHVLHRAVSGDDLVARLGSDEVAVALFDADRVGAMGTIRHLADLLADESVVLPDGESFRLHAYYGLAFSAGLPDNAAVLRAADHARLAAKRLGRDQIAVAGEDTMVLEIDRDAEPEDGSDVTSPRAGDGSSGRS